MARRVAFIGEGPADIGAARGDRRVPCAFEGDLPRAVRRLIQHEGGEGRFGYDVYSIRELVDSIPRYGRPTRSGGKTKDLRDAIVAVLRSHTQPIAIVAVIDVRADELANVRRDVAVILGESERDHPGVPVAIGLAIHEIEAWMLADAESRRAAFGHSAGHPELPMSPEDLPDPKSEWANRAGRAASSRGNTEIADDDRRQAAWQSMRPDVVAHECPIGFAPFVPAVHRALAELID